MQTVFSTLKSIRIPEPVKTRWSTCKKQKERIMSLLKNDKGKGKSRQYYKQIKKRKKII